MAQWSSGGFKTFSFDSAKSQMPVGYLSDAFRMALRYLSDDCRMLIGLPTSLKIVSAKIQSKYLIFPLIVLMLIIVLSAFLQMTLFSILNFKR